MAWLDLGSQARLYDVLTGENLLIIPSGNWVSNVVFSHDARLLAIGGRDSKIALHDTFTSEKLVEMETDGFVSGLCFGERSPHPHKQNRAGWGVPVLVSTTKNDKLQVWPQVASVMAKKVIAFWTQHPAPPVVPIHLPMHILFYQTSDSTRTFLNHAAASDNFKWIESLFKVRGRVRVRVRGRVRGRGRDNV